jgi:hypothetical protein
MRALHLLVVAAMIVVAVPARGEDAPPALHTFDTSTLADAYLAPPPDVAKLRAEDAKQVGGPLRYGVVVPVAGITLETGAATRGIVSTLADGRRLWRVAVSSPGARLLDLAFDRLVLPPGAELTLSSADFGLIRGPITAADLDADPGYRTAFVPGDIAVIEIVAPADVFGAVEASLASVVHGYRGLFDGPEATDKSGSCNVDVACPLGNAWRDPIASVGHYTFVSGGEASLCTGQLVANTRGDTTPLFLTANHCLATNSEAASVVVYWNYQSPTCRTPGSAASGSPLSRSLASHSQSGSSLLATGSNTDFTLLRLSSAVPSGVNAFWSGWDRRDYTPSGAIGIHHPAGHEKRISEDANPLAITAYNGGPGSGSNFLRVADWDQGTTEGGSSGSGLWDRNTGLLVGQLRGGDAACGNDEADWYGRINRSWTGNGTSATRLSDHLDPLGSGVTQLAGYRAGGGGTTIPGGQLQNGVPVGGLAAGTGSAISFTAVLPSGASNLVIRTTGGSGDADLYVRFGSAPTPTAFDCSSNSASSTETCTFANPAAGTWHIAVVGFTTFSGVTLTASWNVPSSPGNRARWDINGDGRSDFTWLNQASGEHYYWLLNGRSTIAQGTLFTSLTWRIVASGDLNADGRSDYIWYNSASGETYYWLMNGPNVIGQGSLLVSSTWRVTHSADLDGNGRDDLLWYNVASGETYAWLINADGSITGGSLFTSPVWRVVAVGDLNGDRRGDLVWHNQASGETYYWMMNGFALTQGGSLLVHPQWRVTTTGDMNGDGRSDLVWLNPVSGETYYWMMNGAQILQQGTVLVSAFWRVTGTGDLNGDGRADFIWYNAATGESFAWLMNGAFVIDQYSVFTSPVWRIVNN